MNRFKERKIVESLAYLAERLELTDIKAYKLLWLSDRLHLGRYARTITGDQYYALEHGPIPSYVKKIVNGRVKSEDFISLFNVSGKSLLLVSTPHRYDYLSDSDKQVLDEVIAAYGSEDEEELSRVSHLSPEWKRQEPKLRAGEKKSYKMNLDDFFEDFPDPKKKFLRNGEPEIAKSVFYCD